MQESQLNISGARLRKHIEKKPYTQNIDGINYTYAILPKKQKTFVLTNQRFLLLSGVHSISYGYTLPANVELPFKSRLDIPKPKVCYDLGTLQNCNYQMEKLTIQFANEDQPKWQFICSSKSTAQEWRRKIQIATGELQKFYASKMERYEDYLAMKQASQEEERRRKQQQNRMLFQTPEPSRKMEHVNIHDSPVNHLVANTVDVLIKPPQKQHMPLTLKQTTSIEQSQHPSPNTSDIHKLERLLVHQQPEQPAPFLNKSVSTLTINTRENIKSDIAILRRHWLEQLIAHKEQTELLIDFQKYVQKVVEVIVSQLHIPQQNKMFPFQQCQKDYASYLIDDLEIEIYFYNQEQLEKSHLREKHAVKEFKNYDYFLESTQNQGILLVPFMTLFEYKGFTGMAKTVVGSQMAPYANKECLSQLNLDLFREDSRIDPRILLDENKCKIVRYSPQSLALNQQPPVYFIERFNEFLPSEISEKAKQKFVLRPELIQDPSLETYTFGDRQRQAGPYEIQTLIANKITELIATLEKQEDYFTNSKELANLLHSFGLNIRHLGLIFKQCHQVWLKKILQSELAARCVKPFFRFDMQNCILNQTERIDPRQMQSQREKKRAIAFLNILLGNGQPTYHLWRSINQYCRRHFQVQIWEQRFEDININWLLQALQSHLNITLSDQIHQRGYFQSMRALADSDFVKFEAGITIYNLDFSQTFEEIYNCLEQKNSEHFSHLCQMMTRQTSKNKPYLFLLKEHPIYNQICEYFLYFITPDEYHQFYSTLDDIQLPSKFAYECHLTQIKWFIKNKPENIHGPINFISKSGHRWLGQQHPLFVKMHHTLAQYYMDEPRFYPKALSHANQSLQLQQILNNGDNQWMWRDYYLIGKIHALNENYQNSFPLLMKAKQLVNYHQLKDHEHYAELILTICKVYYQTGNYREAYTLTRQLYGQLKEHTYEELQLHLLECVKIIKAILEGNQQYQAYYKFVQSDYSQLIPQLMTNAYCLRENIRVIILPYLKYLIHRHVNIRNKISQLVDALLMINISEQSAYSFLEINIQQGKFPRELFGALRDIDKVIDTIYANNMVERWVSFNRMSNQTLLERIGGSQLSRQFLFLAQMTSVLGLVGEQARREFIFMEK